MELLLTLDENNYTDDMPLIETTTVRAILRRNGKYGMQRSAAGWYKIPGGGMEGDESHADTLLREVGEEIGEEIIPESMTPLGKIIELREDRKSKGHKFVRHTLYYACEVTGRQLPLHMTASEEKLGFTPVWADISEIIDANHALFCDRDTDFLEMIVSGRITLP